MMRLALALAIALLAAPAAFAADGVLEINQACAASGCFAGDTAGFPVTITATGSYRLTGNLVLPSSTSGIVIQTGNVTLDLGGFEVRGNNTCIGYPVTSCLLPSGVSGISMGSGANEFLAVVRNGKVIGMPGVGIALLGNSSAVENVTVFYCGLEGIRVGFGGRVAHSFSGSNRFQGIRAGDGSTIENNEVRGNGAPGISIDDSLLGGSVIGNRVLQNSNGINIGGAPTGSPVILSRNIVAGNTAGTIDSGTSLGDNICNGARC
jgi:parallel beta-helix repeat protein